MSNKLDIHNQFTAIVALAPIVDSNDTVLSSLIIDTAGYDGIEFIIQSGILADAGATFTVALNESDDSGMSGGTAVGAADLYGSITAWTEASDGLVQQFGYRGAKRYLQFTITPSGNAGSAPFSGVAIGRKKKV